MRLLGDIISDVLEAAGVREDAVASNVVWVRFDSRPAAELCLSRNLSSVDKGRRCSGMARRACSCIADPESVGAKVAGSSGQQAREIAASSRRNSGKTALVE